jgi:hypothetical protein
MNNHEIYADQLRRQTFSETRLHFPTSQTGTSQTEGDASPYSGNWEGNYASADHEATGNHGAQNSPSKDRRECDAASNKTVNSPTPTSKETHDACKQSSIGVLESQCAFPAL